MAARKSYIEIGWRLDKAGLNEANRETDNLVRGERDHGREVEQTTRYITNERRALTETARQTRETTQYQTRSGNEARKTASYVSLIGDAARSTRVRIQAISGDLNGARNKALSLKDVFKGSLIGAGVISGINLLKNGFTSLYTEMSNNAKAWSTFEGNMMVAGKSSKQINAARQDMQTFAQQTIYNASDMASTFSQLEATGVKGVSGLVKGFGGLAASAPDAKQAMKTLSMQATQMAAQPMVRWQDMRLMIQQAPAAMKQVAKQMNMSYSEMLNETMGKNPTLRTDEFFGAMSAVGNSQYYRQMATQYKTAGEALDGLRENLANSASPAFNRFNKIAIKAISGVNDALTGIGGKELERRLDPAFDSIEDLLTFVQENGKYLVSIGSSIGTIGKNAGTGAWKTFSTMINIIAGKGPGASTSVKSIADSMQEIASHKTTFQVIGGVLTTMFVASKALKYAEALQKVARGLTAVEVAETAGSESGGTGVLPTSKTFSPVTPQTGTRVAALQAKRMSQLATGGVALDAGINIVSAIREGVDSKQGGKDLWQGAGTAVGGAIGSTFGPAGTAIGASIGNVIAGHIADSKVVKDTNAFEQRNIKNYNNSKTAKTVGGYDHLRTDPYGGTTTLRNPDDPANYKVKSTTSKRSNKPVTTRTNLDQATHAWAVTGSTTGLNKVDTSYINKAASLEEKANITWAGSANKTYTTVKSAYDKLLQLAQDHTAKQLSTDKKGYDYLVKQGLLSSNSAKSAYDAEKTGTQTRLANLKQSINGLITADKNGGKSRVKAIDSVNKQILSLTDAGGKKQATLTKSLNARTAKLTVAGYGNVISASSKAYKETTSSANKTYRTQVATANARYKKEVSIANSTKGLSASQRATIIANAKKQRNETISNAETQRNSTVSWAKSQRKAVVSQAEKQAGEVTNAFKIAVGDIASSIPTLVDSNTKAGLFSPQKKVSNTQAIKNYVNPGKTLATAKAQTSKGTTPKIKVATGFATGGGISRNQLIAANEGGTEVAYDPRTGKFRLLGNGPVFAHVKAGERIINARDTAKMFGGGLGAGKTLPGYASGTGSVSISTSGNTGNVAKLTKPSTKGISDVSKAYAATTKKSNKSINSFNSTSKKSWKSITSDTKKQSNAIQKNTVADFDQMQKGVHSQMVQMDKQVDANSKAMVKNFGSNISRLDNYAHSAMSDAISQLNKGFSSVNSVLGQFGGSKSVLKLAHYAQGTNGPIANDQYAVLNDAKSGPMQEAVVRNNQLMKPQGRNAVVPLKQGDEVLNGHALEKLPHYAKGTGKDALKRVIENNQKNPTKAFESDFASRLGAGIGTTLSAGVNANDKGGASSVGNPWYSSVWNVLSDAMSGGSAAGGSWAHSPGAGWSHTDVFGSPRSGGVHDGNDYSAGQGSVIHAVHGGKVVRAAMPPGGWGAVGYSIITKGDDGQYVMYQEFGHANNAKVSMGDTVKTGQPIATLGHSGLGTGPHVHIGVSKNYPFSNNGMSTSGWENLMDMRGGSSGVSKKDKNAKGDSTLDKYVKKQLAGQVKWVSKNLSDEVGDIGSLGISGSIASRAKILAAAIKKAYPSATNSGIAAVLGNWEFESGLNPGAINPGGGASGLGQWLGGRKTNLINYARKHGQNWNNAGAQLDFALHGDGSDSSVLKRILSGTGSVASLANQFSSQWERGGYNAQHVAGAMKIASALKGFAGGGHPGTGQTVLVGEHGPELARFEQPATIYSNAASPQVAGQLANGATSTLGGRTVSIKMEVNVKAIPGADGKKFGSQAGDAIVDRLKVMFNGERDTRNEQ